MVYTESIRGYPYMRKEQLAKEFQISVGTVRTRLFEIENEIKTGRYNDYAVIKAFEERVTHGFCYIPFVSGCQVS